MPQIFPQIPVGAHARIVDGLNRQNAVFWWSQAKRGEYPVKF